MLYINKFLVVGLLTISRIKQRCSECCNKELLVHKRLHFFKS